MNPVSRRALFAMSSLALASPAAQKHEASFAAAYQHIDAVIPRYMRERNTPGLALAITNRISALIRSSTAQRDGRTSAAPILPDIHAMNRDCSRRKVLIGGTLALAGCARTRSQYFGDTPPTTQRLVFESGSEAGSLDPAKCFPDVETYVQAALFEG